MIILNTNKHFHGQVVNLPIAGATQIGTDGTVEVSDEVGTLMVQNGGADWTTPELVKAAAEEALKEQADANDDGNISAEEQSNLNEALAALETMSVDEMLDLAKSAGIKGYHLFKNKPEVLRKYIANKLKA